MPFEVYKLLHLIGLFLIFVSLGGLLLHVAQGGTRQSLGNRQLVFATHGFGLLLVLVSGFGMLAKLGIMANMPGWVWAKIVVWILIGGVVALPLRVQASAKPLWLLLPLLGGLAAWLAIFKPF